MVVNQYMDITAQPEYDSAFWDHMKDLSTNMDVLNKGVQKNATGFKMPNTSTGELNKAIRKESVFRGISTVVDALGSGYSLDATDNNDLAQFVPEGGEIPITDGMEDFTKISVGSHKLVVLVKLDEDFVHDATFDVEKYLVRRLGRNFGMKEDDAFINGSGDTEPIGILHESDGAEVGVTTSSLTYDDVISLYFSANKRYRRNGVWIMNDATALILRKLKDKDGNYLWNSNTDTILGKQVVISEFMPDIEEGAKPIAFGDFSYYWIINRRYAAMRLLKEPFVVFDQLGYLATEYLDGKLIRKDAVKVLQITTS